MKTNDQRKEMDLVDWLTTLAIICQPADIPDAITRMGHLIPFLVRYPWWVFCPASAVWVENYDRKRATPSLSEITRPLDGWIERNTPTDEQRQQQVDKILADQAERRRLAKPSA